MGRKAVATLHRGLVLGGDSRDEMASVIARPP
jgi:predicted Zn-dependent protease